MKETDNLYNLDIFVEGYGFHLKELAQTFAITQKLYQKCAFPKYWLL